MTTRDSVPTLPPVPENLVASCTGVMALEWQNWQKLKVLVYVF